MAERITRPTVRLAGGLPDGNLSSLETLGARLLSDAPPDVYALVLITRHKREENDDQDGAELAICKVRALESFPIKYERGAAAVFPFDVAAGELVADVLQRLRTERTGDQTLPLATSAEAAQHDQAMEALRQWADTNLDEQRDGLAAVWNDYFGDRSPQGTVTAWRDAPTQMIREFLLAKGEELDDEQQEQADNAEQARELDGSPSSVPCPDWSHEVAHDAHQWDAPVDGLSWCPGWGEPGGEKSAPTPARALSSVPAATFAGPGDDA